MHLASRRRNRYYCTLCSLAGSGGVGHGSSSHSRPLQPIHGVRLPLTRLLHHTVTLEMILVRRQFMAKGKQHTDFKANECMIATCRTTNDLVNGILDIAL
jgi:hypothetical protein